MVRHYYWLAILLSLLLKQFSMLADTIQLGTEFHVLTTLSEMNIVKHI